MPVTEHGARAAPPQNAVHPGNEPRRVARCLFGRPDPEELERMEREVDAAERQRAMEQYGVDLVELTKRDDIDTLVVRRVCAEDTEQAPVLPIQVQAPQTIQGRSVESQTTNEIQSISENQIEIPINEDQINGNDISGETAAAADEMQAVDLSTGRRD